MNISAAAGTEVAKWTKDPRKNLKVRILCIQKEALLQIKGFLNRFSRRTCFVRPAGEVCVRAPRKRPAAPGGAKGRGTETHRSGRAVERPRPTLFVPPTFLLISAAHLWHRPGPWGAHSSGSRPEAAAVLPSHRRPEPPFRSNIRAGSRCSP